MKNNLILVSILTLALFLRLTGIHWGLPTKTGVLATYHPDEAFVFQSLQNMKQTNSLNPGQIGLNYGTLYVYVAGGVLFAASIVGELFHVSTVRLGSRSYYLEHLDEADRLYLALRWFSVFLGIISILGTYVLGKRVFDHFTGLLGAFLMAVAPVNIMISHYAKLDALLPPLVIALLWMTMNLMEGNK